MDEQIVANDSYAKRRLFLLDFVRIICAFLIWGKHSRSVYGCDYPYIIKVIFYATTSPVMTLFFILSGFSLHYQHKAELLDSDWIKAFYKKRLISIIPSYFLVCLVYPFCFPEQIKDWVVLLPVDLFGIKTIYRTLFGILHNGGTWFVSCLLFCYIIYPIVKVIINNSNKLISLIILLVIHFLLMYSNIVIMHYSLDSLYSNPITRCFEFSIGIIFAELVFSFDIPNKHIYSGWFVVIYVTLISLILGILSSKDNLQNFILTFFPIPVILIILLLSTKIFCERLENSKVLSTFSGMSYQFFLAQIFLWKITDELLHLFGLKGNLFKIFGSLGLCTLISYLVYKFYDKPVKKFLNRKLKKKVCIMVNSDNGWRCYQHCFIRNDYETPISGNPDFNEIEREYLKDKSKNSKEKCFFAQYITAFDVNSPTEWWFTIKDDFYDLTKVNSKKRYEITKAKKFCYAKKITAYDYASRLFDCYRESFTAYPVKYRPTHFDFNAFKETCRQWDRDENQRIYATFLLENDLLIGFCVVIHRGKMLNLSQLKTNPAFEKYNSNASLVDCMLTDWNKQLKDGSVIISNGSRSIKHETNFNSYLEKYFGFRKAYCNLRVVYKFPFGIIIKLFKPFKKFLKLSNNSLMYNLYCVMKLDDFSTKKGKH